MPLSSADPAANVGVGIQTALGTPQTTAGKFRFVKYLSGSSVEGQIEAVDEREGGDGLDFGLTYKKSQKVVGQIVANARPENLGQLLAIVPGNASWDGGSAPGVHNYNTGHASHPWSTLQIAHPGTSIVHYVSDARFTGLSLEAMSGQPWKFTFPFIGINHGASSAYLTPTYYGDDPFFFFSTPSYQVDGAADTDITGFKLDISLGVEELQSQAVTLDEIVVQNRDSNFELTRRYESPTLWQKIYMGAGVTPTTSIATGSFDAIVLYGAGAALRKLRVMIPLLSYRGDALTELDPDGKTVIETVSAKALKGATHAVIFQLSNVHASQYAT